MNTSFQRSTASDEWYTPPSVIEALSESDLDPCAAHGRITAKNHLYKEHDGYAEAKLNIYTRPHRRECWVAKYIVSAKTIPYDGAGYELMDALYEVLYKLLDNHVKLD